METVLMLNFRPATIEDQPFIYDLIKASLPDIVGVPVPDWSWDDFLRSWERGTKIIVALDESRVGFLRWEHDPDALHLADLQVMRSHRRQGIASKAIAHFEQQAAAEGFGKVSLVVHDANRAAGPLYVKLGYRCETRDGGRSLLIKSFS